MLQGLQDLTGCELLATKCFIANAILISRTQEWHWRRYSLSDVLEFQEPW